LAKRPAGFTVPDFLKRLCVDVTKIHFWNAANTREYVTIQPNANVKPRNIAWNPVQNVFPDPISEAEIVDVMHQMQMIQPFFDLLQIIIKTAYFIIVKHERINFPG
jgi:hypothetical protein